MRVWVALVAVLLVAGCASGQATANLNLTPAPVPKGWSDLSWTDPGLKIAVPGGWIKSDPKQTATPTDMGSMTPAMLKAVQWSNEMASSGKTRLASYGRLETPLGALEGGSLDVYVESGDTSLAAFADREERLDEDLGAQLVDRSTVVLPGGPAVRLSLSGQLGDASTKYNEVDYLILLPDGRSMTVAVAGNGQAAVPSAVSDFAARVIATLRPSS